MLTTLAIKRLKTGNTLTDTSENAGLRVTRGKNRTTFWYRYRHPDTGKLSRVTLGHYPLMSLSEARVKLHELKDARREGVNPASLIRSKKPQYVPDEATVEDIINEYLKGHVYKNRKPKGASDTDRLFTNCVIPHLGGRSATTVTRRDVLSLVNVQIEKGHNVQAGRVLAELSSAFEFGILTGNLPDDFINPCVLAKASLKVMRVKLSGKKRSRFLTMPEIKRLLDWLDQPKIVTQNHRRAMLLTLQLGVRSGEAINAKWSDFNLDKATWYLPDTKTDTPRTILLPTQTLAWMSAERLLRPLDAYLCPSPKGNTSIQQKSITERLWFLKRENRLPDIPHWTPHDLRRTCRTHLSRLGCPHEVAEAALGHTIGGVAGVYNLHRYESEVGEWLQVWNDELEALR